MKYTIKPTHISEIKHGDTVEVAGGIIKTVGRSDIRNGFMGITLWGDSYRSGNLPVNLVCIQTPRPPLRAAS